MPFDLHYMALEMKKKRIDKGWDQQDLANASGVSRDSISRYEAEMNAPTFESACKIADAFGCKTDDFWSREAQVGENA